MLWPSSADSHGYDALPLLVDPGDARGNRQAQNIGPRPAIGIGDHGDILAHRRPHQRLGAEHAFDVAQGGGRGMRGCDPVPDDAVDPLAAEAHADHHARQRLHRESFIDEIVEGLPQMRGLNVEHHLHHRQFVRLLVCRSSLAPLAGRQPVKRELFGMRFGHGYSVRSRRSLKFLGPDLGQHGSRQCTPRYRLQAAYD
jgi:hypothetical protein